MYPIFVGFITAATIDYVFMRRPMFKAMENYNKALEEQYAQRLDEQDKLHKELNEKWGLVKKSKK